MQIQLGDWVTQLSAGIFQVERTVTLKNKPPSVVLKKGFTNKLKPYISWDTCAVSLCKKVSEEQLAEIRSLLERDMAFAKRFHEYVIPEIQQLHNMSVLLPPEKDVEAIEWGLDLEKNCKTLQEIKEILCSYGVQLLGSVHSRGSVNLQLVCVDYETNSHGDLVYRKARFYLG